MPSPSKELRQAYRKLARTPLFTIVALATLAVGIGANAAIFTVLSGVLLKPLPYPQADRLVGVWHTAPGINIPEMNLSDAMYFHYRKNAGSFESIALYDGTEVNLTGGERPERLAALRVTADFFRVLRVEPVLGRGFTEADDAAQTPGAVVLTHGLWQRRFGGDRGILERTIRVDGQERPVVGVLAQDFTFDDGDAQLILTLRLDPANVNTGSFNYDAVARLRDGVTAEQATAEVTRLAYQIPDVYGGPIERSMLEQAKVAGDVHPLMEDVVEDVGSALWILFGMVGIVLLIACANVANLVLVRADSRHREVAVRTALGAGRATIAREFVLESLMLALAGGLAGLGIAWAAVRLLLRLEPQNLPRLDAIGIDVGVVAFTVTLSVVAGLLLGLLPMLRFRGLELTASLKEGGRGGSAGRERHRAQNSLVVVQLALALLLMVGSGLMLRSFAALRNVDPGFDSPASLLTATLAIPTADYEEPARVEVLHRELLDRVRAIPGVESAGFATAVPFDESDSNSGTWIEDQPTPEGGVPPIIRTVRTGDGYFDAMGIPVLAGRALTAADMQARARVVVVSETMAREFWGEPAAAVGRRISQGEPGPERVWWQIVGVVGDVRDDGLDEPAPSMVYFPAVGLANVADTQDFYASRTIVLTLRTSRPPLDLVSALRQAVAEIGPTLPLARVRTMGELQARSMARTSFMMVMLAIAAAMALFLAAVGIYGVISYVVGQRTREIGVRMALGAASGTVAGMVVRRGLVLASIGVVLGLTVALGLSQLMGSLLYGVNPIDPLTFAAVAAGLVGTAVVASWVPARRAARLDPVDALRCE